MFEFILPSADRMRLIGLNPEDIIEIPIERIMEDTDLTNQLGNESRRGWEGDPSGWKFDESQREIKRLSATPSLYVDENGKLSIEDGRHRIQAIANAGYTHIKLPVRNGRFLKGLEKGFGGK